nr:MAG TPA_asm: hypothetical protein [Caudoviricetes sp.]
MPEASGTRPDPVRSRSRSAPIMVPVWFDSDNRSGPDGLSSRLCTNEQ